MDPEEEAKKKEEEKRIEKHEEEVRKQQEKDKEKDEIKKKEGDEAMKVKDDENTASFATLAAKAKANMSNKTEMQQFETKMVGGEAMFLCDRCDYMKATNRAVKAHWTRKHRREAQEEEEAVAKGKPVSEKESKKVKPNDKEYNLMDYFGDDGRPLEETITESTFNETLNESMETYEAIDLTSTPKAKSPVKLDYQDELNVKTAEVESLKEAIKLKQEMLNLANGKIASLEEEDIEKAIELDKAKRIMSYMNEKIEENKKGKKGDEPKLRKELSVKNKEVKELQNKLNEAMKKIREETNQRAKAEADVILKDHSLQLLREILERRDSSTQQAEANRPPSPRDGIRERSTELCRDFKRQGFCYRGSSCRFFHPPGSNKPSSQPEPIMKPDCAHWLAGYCRNREDRCRGKHEANKCGTQTKQYNQVKPTKQQDFNNPDFVQSLVKAVSQSLAGVQSVVQAPPSGQKLVDNQPKHQNMNQQQPMMVNRQHQQQSMQQQPMMMPMMMMPPGQNMFYPNLQGGQGSKQ